MKHGSLFSGIGGFDLAAEYELLKKYNPHGLLGKMFVDLLVGGGGLVFDEVCADLEREGYEVQPFLIPAAGVNAPHRRDRIWFVANSNSKRIEECNIPQEPRKKKFADWEDNANRKHWERFPTQSPIRGGDDGVPKKLDGIAFSRWRNESIKAYGNAIVPQVAYEIFKTIEIFKKILPKNTL